MKFKHYFKAIPQSLNRGDQLKYQLNSKLLHNLNLTLENCKRLQLNQVQASPNYDLRKGDVIAPAVSGHQWHVVLEDLPGYTAAISATVFRPLVNNNDLTFSFLLAAYSTFYSNIWYLNMIGINTSNVLNHEISEFNKEEMLTYIKLKKSTNNIYQLRKKQEKLFLELDVAISHTIITNQSLKDKVQGLKLIV